MTDHCAIDRDQAAIESQLALQTFESFANAQRIYEEGGNSESYARLTLPSGLMADLPKGKTIWGKNEKGGQVEGMAYQDYEKGDKIIKVRYAIKTDQANYVGCQVGALLKTNSKFCFAGEGNLKIEEEFYSYNYDPATENRNGRTM